MSWIIRSLQVDFGVEEAKNLGSKSAQRNFKFCFYSEKNENAFGFEFQQLFETVMISLYSGRRCGLFSWVRCRVVIRGLFC